MADNLDDYLARSRAALDESLRGLVGIDRAKQHTVLLDFLGDLTSEYSRQRRGELDTLTDGGWSQADIARGLEMSSARVNKIVKNPPPKERAFFGAGRHPLTVAVGQKLEGGKEKPGGVVAEEDLLAYENLRKFSEGMRLRTQHEVIRPPGHVNLNRDGLVIICGPRLSPLIGQILESDSRYGFSKDDTGWHLIDRETGESFRSPEDSGQAGDIAYLGRLPRPDGKGDFLYIAGIHAAGAGVAIHYLTHNLDTLYPLVRNRRFSTLVAGEYDPETRIVSSSRLIGPIHRLEG